MGMDVGGDGGGKVKPEMNVTPLVDIVLVLLIIFLVLAPVMAKSLFVRIPPKQEELDEEIAELVNDDQPPVLYVMNDGEQLMDGRLSLAENPDDLRLVLNARSDRQVFIDAEDDTEFRHLIEAINFARASGAKPVVMLAEPFKLPGK